MSVQKMYVIVAALVLCTSSILRIAEACSSRSTPKPRAPVPTSRPNITFPTFACPTAYATWYCLNGATCFTVEIQESILYNCVCADGYTGPRCEFKDLDGSYLPSREKIMVERASIAGGVTLAILLIVLVSIACYIYGSLRKKQEGDYKQKPFYRDTMRPTPGVRQDAEAGEGSSSPCHTNPCTSTVHAPSGESRH